MCGAVGDASLTGQNKAEGDNIIAEEQDRVLSSCQSTPTIHAGAVVHGHPCIGECEAKGAIQSSPLAALLVQERVMGTVNVCHIMGRQWMWCSEA